MAATVMFHGALRHVLRLRWTVAAASIALAACSAIAITDCP